MSDDRKALAYHAYHAWRTAQKGSELTPGEFEATYSRTEAEWMEAVVDAVLAILPRPVLPPPADLARLIHADIHGHPDHDACVPSRGERRAADVAHRYARDEREVREEIAREIEAWRDRRLRPGLTRWATDPGWMNWGRRLLMDAARIARGEVKP